jgi:hypothetical protein
MELEFRLKAIEDLAQRNAAKVIALELAVRSLISTHQDRILAAQKFDLLSAEILDRATELGFEGGLPASVATTQKSLLRDELQTLRGCF